MEWKVFRIEEITEKINIAKSKNYGDLKKGDTVFIGRQENNNGIQGYVDCECCEKKDCITVSMVATRMKAFWQSYDFATSQNILILRNKKYNKYIALFICCVLNNYLLPKYGYGNPVKVSTFPKEKIMLPVNNLGEPDYEYMEQYIKNMEYNKIIDYLGHIA